MKKIYMVSRVILAAITFILVSIMIINKDSSWKSIPIICSLIVLVVSFPSTIFAKKIIEKGNKIENKFLKLAYYAILPIVLLVIYLAFNNGILSIDDIFGPAEDALGYGLHALVLIFIGCAIFIMKILPYIQAIIINILKRILE